MLLSKAYMTINFESKINWTCCFGFLLLFHNVWLLCGISTACLCVLNHFSPCSAARAAAFTFLHSQDHACTTKIYKSQNKNILSTIIAGQTSLSLLDFIFAPQQIAPDKSGAANKCFESVQGLTISCWHGLGFADWNWVTTTSTEADRY